jgi:hypothetical protein
MALATQKATCDHCGQKIEHDAMHFLVASVKVIPDALVEKMRLKHDEEWRNHQREYERALEEHGPFDMNDPKALEKAGLPAPPQAFDPANRIEPERHYHESCYSEVFGKES